MSGVRIAPIYDPVLKSSPLFEDLSDLELNAVAAFLEPRRIKEGEDVFREGSSGEEMFILVSGKISAWVNQTDGSRRLMFEISPGDFFGEMSIIANESRSATLTATVDTELSVLNGIDFYRIIFVHPIIGIKMLKAIKRVQNMWLEQTSRSLGDLMRWGETARRRAVCDELTGLYNRRFLEKTANDRFETGAVGLRSVSLLMMDLDKIHEINELYGTKGGDLVFIATAEVLRSVTRPGDICSRLSGDEFAILLPDTEQEEAFGIAQRICETIASHKIRVLENPDGTGKTGISVTTSLGIATAPVHADSWEKLCSVADTALHRSKELGRNRVETA
jgi:diguanylate cyclase (GGDEF)-like protein